MSASVSSVPTGPGPSSSGPGVPLPPRHNPSSSTGPTGGGSNNAPPLPPSVGAPAASAPSTGSAPGVRGAPSPAPTHVSEASYEFLLAEVLHWVERECAVSKKQSETDDGTAPGLIQEEIEESKHSGTSSEEAAILSAERAAAKIERIGFNVGYRLCERLAQNKPLGPPPGAGGSNTPSGQDPAAGAQLEAVKFLCKEFWTEVFRKQIDKLQTNHRGVFVLKDNELRWLRRLPPDDERARVSAIKMLAFPCGLIRGALGNLGIPAVVSCDFLADGRNMASCSFNIKIK